MLNQNNPKILVVGTGAIGGFYGGKLAQSGARIGTWSRSDYDVVKSKGYSVKSCWGDFDFKPEKVICDLKEYDEEPDYILVTLKSLPGLDVVSMIQNIVAPKTSIVILQNGIDIEYPITQAFPNNVVISGLAFICVSRYGKGKIHHLDFGRITLGRYPSGESEPISVLQKLFKISGVPCEVSKNIISERWRKLLWNIPFNSISVLGGGLTTKEMIGNSNTLGLIQEIMNEVCQVAKAAGYEIPISIMQKHIEDTEKMASYKTSMLLDFESGRSMEIESILGNTIRIAQRKNIDVPRLDCLYRLLQSLEAKQH